MIFKHWQTLISLYVGFFHGWVNITHDVESMLALRSKIHGPTPAILRSTKNQMSGPTAQVKHWLTIWVILRFVI